MSASMGKMLAGFKLPPGLGERLSVENLIAAALIVIIGGLTLRLLAEWSRAVLKRRVSSHVGWVVSTLIRYLGWTVIFMGVLRVFGIGLGPLFGAAGIIGVAVGFASQTSLGNLISGFFLIGEKPFQVGDVLKVGETTGEVLDIDPLSVKLRTFDNHLVRIPNESLLKSQLTNLTRFPLRRVDLKLGVAYKEDLAKVWALLERIAHEDRQVLVEPKPIFIHQGFGGSSVDFTFAVWTRTENFLDVRNRMYLRIKEVFDREGVEIPFPHLSLYAGEVSKPIAVQRVGDQAA